MYHFTKATILTNTICWQMYGSNECLNIYQFICFSLQVKFNRVLCMVILGIWSLSLLQFSLVLTAARARRDQSGLCPRNTNRKNRIGCCQADVYGIIVSILMQDAPFLVLRMWLIFRHKVLSYTNMFFTSKNTLVIILLIYRLIVIQIEKSSDESRDDMADSRSNRSRDNVSMTDTSTVGSKSHLVNSVSCSNDGSRDTTPRTCKRRDDRVRLARTPTPEGLNSPVWLDICDLFLPFCWIFTHVHAHNILLQL